MSHLDNDDNDNNNENDDDEGKKAKAEIEWAKLIPQQQNKYLKECNFCVFAGNSKNIYFP